MLLRYYIAQALKRILTSTTQLTAAIIFWTLSCVAAIMGIKAL